MGEVILPVITSPRTSPPPHALMLDGREVSANDTDEGRDDVSRCGLTEAIGAAA